MTEATRRVASIHPVRLASSPVRIIVVSQWLKCATASTTAKTTSPPTRPTNAAPTTAPVLPTTSNARTQTSAWNRTGYVTATTIAVITATKIHFIVLRELARRTVSGVLIIDVSRRPGTATATMIVSTAATNRRVIVNQKAKLALAICLLVIMEIVFPEFTSAMVIMTVWITQMKMTDTSVVSCIFLLHIVIVFKLYFEKI